VKKLLAIALCIFLLIAALPYKATGEEATITAENQNGSMISISGVRSCKISVGSGRRIGR